MYQRVSFQDFIDAFIKMERGGQFTYEGFEALYNHLLSIEDDTGKQIELDVIAICVEYAEYPSAIDAVADYTLEQFESEGQAIEYLVERTIVIHFDGGVIVQNF
jgi:hypothetical protein